MMYRATAAVGILVLLGAGSVAMAADRQEQEDVQREIYITPLVEGEAVGSPTGALREQTPAERPAIGMRNPRSADKAQSDDGVLPSWLRWPPLTDF